MADPDSGGADPEVRSEASWAVLNATSCGSDQQVMFFFFFFAFLCMFVCVCLCVFV